MTPERAALPDAQRDRLVRLARVYMAAKARLGEPVSDGVRKLAAERLPGEGGRR